jgi:hypothetical protein
MSSSAHQIIDGDGHVMEDIASIWKYMPQEYAGRSFSDMRGRSPFPPIDHLHTAASKATSSPFPSPSTSSQQAVYLLVRLSARGQ